MNKKTLALISAVVMLSACEPPAQKTEQAHTDTTVKDTTVNIPVKASPTKAEGIAKKIKGDWVSTQTSTGNVTFIIGDSTFVYPNVEPGDPDEFKYKLDGDSVTIYYTDFTEKYGVSFKGDTMCLANDIEPHYYTRMKQ